jgi:hypothetical protein
MSHPIVCLDLDAGASKRVISLKRLLKNLPNLKILKLKGCTVKSLEGVESSKLQVFSTVHVTFLQPLDVGVFPSTLQVLRMVGRQAYPVMLRSNREDYFGLLVDLWLFGMDLSSIQLPRLPHLRNLGLQSTRHAPNLFSYERAPRLQSALLEGNEFICDASALSGLPMNSLVHTDYFGEPVDINVSLLPSTIENLIMVGNYLLSGSMHHLPLKRLRLCHCHIVHPHVLLPLQTLTVLDLSHITYNDYQANLLWKSFFRECISLRSITLSDIPFDPDSFDPCSQLRSLDITCKESRELSVASLSEHLEVLCLRGIILQDQPSIRFQKLTRLELQRIDAATELILACPNLHVLLLEHHVHVDVEQMTCFHQFTHLETTVPFPIALFPSLKKLTMDGHSFAEPWKELEVWQSFCMQEATFRNMTIDLCKHRFPNLLKLKIDRCQLKCLSFLHQCPRIQVVILQGNSLPKQQLDTLWYWQKKIPYFCLIPSYIAL